MRLVTQGQKCYSEVLLKQDFPGDIYRNDDFKIQLIIIYCLCLLFLTGSYKCDIEYTIDRLITTILQYQ